jgi:3-isopropylmalate/(R)-2-methylmalate dehydratase small subunit
VKALRRVEGVAAVLDRADVDTDQIVPKQFLKRIERTGFGEFLFFDWRKDPGFELNRPEYAGATVLVSGRNFGCGSSREHAAWALQDAGFDVVVAPSFGDIFRTNALKIGLLPIALAAGDVRTLTESGGKTVAVDVDARTITDASGRTFAFELDDFHRERLLEGLDDIGLTLRREAEIDAYEAEHAAPIDTGALIAGTS